MLDNNDNAASQLILLCGLPGAGKTTLARELSETLPAIRLCPDDWMSDLNIDLHDEEFRDRLEARFKKLGYEILSAGQNVILEFGFWVRSERDEVREAAQKLGAAVELRYLNIPLEELWSRIEARNQSEMWNDTPITRQQFDSWLPLFQVPTDEEFKLFDSHA